MTPDLTDAVAGAVLAHPSVARLDGGPLGTVATHLPGRRVTGVRTTGEGVEIAVVLTLDRPLAEVGQELRALVRDLAGPVPVDVTVTDVVVAA
ncbi:hypothetical protein EWH70_23430 [Amycolatopsis suaedae]|uniref:Asp23/Gls24 family envelope stress response protein n=2 Tax=Amycolatopsis suaedae TaxID=2510978 RepID=A0A4V2ELH1_9PSEU|nr:hypothetical protein EWH70_23430 [Amycolatopsis suaedae]